MLGHFPSPFSDELLYSICARYSRRVSYSNAKAVLQELLGATTATAVADLPNRLSHLASALPPGTSLTVDNLINRYTLLPFFSAFLPPERVKLIRKDMRVSSGPAAHMRSGAMGSRIPMPDFMRFCPACRQEDADAEREPYWHRLHQVSGVEVCPAHRVFLEPSSVGLRKGRDCLSFISAEGATITSAVRHLEETNREHEILLR